MIVNISVKKKAQPFVGKVITWVPRHIAAKLATEYNIISIEYFEEDRPNFLSVNVLPVISGSYSDTCIWKGNECLLSEAIDEFIKQCSGNPIVVHCEMGRVRSRNLATAIAHNFGYKLVDSVKLNTINGTTDFLANK